MNGDNEDAMDTDNRMPLELPPAPVQPMRVSPVNNPFPAAVAQVRVKAERKELEQKVPLSDAELLATDDAVDDLDRLVAEMDRQANPNVDLNAFPPVDPNMPPLERVAKEEEDQGVNRVKRRKDEAGDPVSPPPRSQQSMDEERQIMWQQSLQEANGLGNPPLMRSFLDPLPADSRQAAVPIEQRARELYNATIFLQQELKLRDDRCQRIKDRMEYIHRERLFQLRQQCSNREQALSDTIRGVRANLEILKNNLGFASQNMKRLMAEVREKSTLERELRHTKDRLAAKTREAEASERKYQELYQSTELAARERDVDFERKVASKEGQIQRLESSLQESKRRMDDCKERERRLKEDVEDYRNRYNRLDEYYKTDLQLILGKYLATKPGVVDLVRSLPSLMDLNQLDNWHNALKQWDKRQGTVDMDADDQWSLAEVKQRYDNAVLENRQLTTQLENVRTWFAELVGKLESLKPPDADELAPMDRVAQLEKFVTADNFLGQLYTLIRDALFQSQLYVSMFTTATSAEEKSKRDDRHYFADERRSAIFKPLIAERDGLVTEVQRLHRENSALRTRNHDYAATVRVYQTLVDRVNAVWATLENVVQPIGVPAADIPSLQALAKQQVERLRKLEEGLTSKIQGYRPLLGSTEINAQGLLTKQLEDLNTLVRTQSHNADELKKKIRQLETEAKEHKLLRGLCAELQNWGAQMASTMWYMMVGGSLQPQQLLAWLQRVKLDAQKKTQAEVMKMLFESMVYAEDANRVVSESIVISTLRAYVEEEAKQPGAVPLWLQAFAPTRPPAGMDTSTVEALTGVAPSARLAPVTEQLSVFQYASDESYALRRDELMQQVRSQLSGNGSGVMSVSRGAGATPAPVQNPNGPTRDVDLFGDTVEDEDKQAVARDDEKLAQERNQFYEALAVPSTQPVDHVVSIREPDDVQRLRWKLYSFFALHLKWLVWFSANTPTIESQARWNSTVVTELDKTVQAFNATLDKHFAKEEKQEQERTRLVLHAIQNLVDLQRLEASMAATQGLLSLPAAERERHFGALVSQTSRIWRDARWAEAYPAKELEKYGESRFKALADTWKEETRETQQQIKEYIRSLQEWSNDALAVVRLISSDSKIEDTAKPRVLRQVGDRLKEYQREAKEWSGVAGSVARALNTFERKLRNSEEDVPSAETTAVVLRDKYLPVIDRYLQFYLQWPEACNRAFDTAARNSYVTTSNASLSFVQVREPIHVPTNMDFLLERIALKAQSMEVVTKLLQNRLAGNGPRPPKNATSSTTTTTAGVPIHSRLSCKPRKELLASDPLRIQTAPPDRHKVGQWKSPTRRVFEFLVNMAGNAACDLVEIVMPKYLEDQNGQSLYIIPVDPLDVLSGMQLGEQKQRAEAALPMITDALQQQRAKTEQNKAELDAEIKDLCDRWNNGAENPQQIEEELMTIMTGAGHTAVVAALAFLRRHERRRNDTLLGLITNRKDREPFVDLCAAEYKFRQLQNTATPASQRSPQDRAVVNQSLQAAQFALLPPRV